MSGNPASACFFQPPTCVGWHAEHLRDLGGSLVRLNGLDGHFGLQARWVTLTSLALTILFFNAADHLRKGQFRVQLLGAITAGRLFALDMDLQCSGRGFPPAPWFLN